jgi:hypothetical protein
MKSSECSTHPSFLSSPITNILSHGIPALFAASRTTLSNGTCVNTALAPESLNWNAGSSDEYAGMEGEITPFAHCVPNIRAAVSMQFVDATPTTSPFRQFHSVRNAFPKAMAVSLISWKL